MVVCEAVPLLPLSEFSDSSELLEEEERSVEKHKNKIILSSKCQQMKNGNDISSTNKNKQGYSHRLVPSDKITVLIIGTV